MSRAIGKTLLPKDVEEAIWTNFPSSYAYLVKRVNMWSTALKITPTIKHIMWDDDMWRMGTDLGKEWDTYRNSARPKEAEAVVFDRPTLIQCPACKQNMVHIIKMEQRRGCDEPATVYCTCQNPACKKKLGHFNRFRTEG
jgi:DNA-directed RNA polymerase subunit M/transcription elongation factor TFIIS